ncbi:MAG: hypothetical protein FJZ43_03415 [Candidatus Staskawiczbacteria bacterium]|nr:hypothetical protein [Candidatus Staskawiczbacteria bacterium]
MIFKKNIFAFFLTLLLILPNFSLAVNFIGLPTGNQNYSDSIGWVLTQIFNLIIWPVSVLVIIILFIMAGFSFLTSKGDAAKLEQARRFVIWGIVGVVVILISFSIVQTVKNIIGVT